MAPLSRIPPPLAAFVLFNALALTLSTALEAQTAPAPPPTAPQDQLSPKAAYYDALHPLEVTRHNIANWSDIEIAAMNVAIAHGREACLARNAETYTGSDLVDLTRLCSLGQQWPEVVDAATRYIAAPDSTKPRLAEAYIARIDAQLRLKQEPAALKDALTLLTAAPFTPDVAESIDQTLDYMRFVHTTDALTLAQARQSYVLAALKALGTKPQIPVAAAAGPEATSPAGGSFTARELYAEGLALAALQQLTAQPEPAAASISALEAALPGSVAPDEAIYIAQSRTRYALLGKPISGVHPLTSFSMPTNRLPELPAHGAATAMLLFPDWCAQCVRMTPQMPKTVFALEGHGAHMYALLVETVPQRKLDPKATDVAFSPAFSASMLAETPTVTVSPETLKTFAAAEFPSLILTDANGIVRVLQPVEASDLQPGGTVDAAIALVAKTFPDIAPAQSAPHQPPPPRSLKHRPPSAILCAGNGVRSYGQRRQ